MRLATRLSAFFLAALAIVLVGFSTALYVSAWRYLNRQVDDRLKAALAVLAAATEVHPEGVEWEPEERDLRLGKEASPERLRWCVRDGQGRQVDHSLNLGDDELILDDGREPGDLRPPKRVVDRRGRAWRIAQRRLSGGSTGLDSGSDAASRRSAAHDPPAPGSIHATLILTVAARVDPVDRALANLGGLLVGLSLGVWLVAALLGRWLVRRALAPLSRMVDSARGLDATDAGWSLPLAGTRDELDDLGRAFNDLLGRLRMAYERQRRFGADASHQLRTPLTALIGQIEVALRRDRSDDEYRRVLALVRGQAGGLAQIVESLLFLGRADADAGLPDGTPTDLAAWLAAHVAGHPLADSITLDLEPAWSRVHPPLLGQLVDNLLDNAAKYGRPGGSIVARVRAERDTTTMAVEDEGPGIDPTDLPRVFEPFFRSTRARHLGRQGVGLGLAVVQRIALAFGGVAAVESEPGRGCRVVLRLPRCEAGIGLTESSLAVAEVER